MEPSPPPSPSSESPSLSSGSGSSAPLEYSINSLDEARALSPGRSDFDPVTGKLTPPKSTPPVLANPAALAPTGSPPGKLSPADGFRTMLTGLSVYGLLQAFAHFLEFVGSSADLMPKYGPEIAAVAVSLYHLVTAIMADNTPRPSTEPHRVA
jgi:hypothetical protein